MHRDQCQIIAVHHDHLTDLTKIQCVRSFTELTNNNIIKVEPLQMNFKVENTETIKRGKWKNELKRTTQNIPARTGNT